MLFARFLLLHATYLIPLRMLKPCYPTRYILSSNWCLLLFHIILSSFHYYEIAPWNETIRKIRPQSKCHKEMLPRTVRNNDCQMEKLQVKQNKNRKIISRKSLFIADQFLLNRFYFSHLFFFFHFANSGLRLYVEVVLGHFKSDVLWKQY